MPNDVHVRMRQSTQAVPASQAVPAAQPTAAVQAARQPQSASATQTTQPAQPFVTKAGEIWRTYGNDVRAGRFHRGSAGTGGAGNCGTGTGGAGGFPPETSLSACDLGPGNSSPQSFAAGNPCGDGLPQSADPAAGTSDPDAELDSPDLKQATARSPSSASKAHSDSEHGGNAAKARQAATTAPQEKTHGNTAPGMLASLLAQHEHATIYATAGIAIAILIIAIGILPTLLIAVLAVIGLLIGRYRDGDMRLRGLLRSAASRMSK